MTLQALFNGEIVFFKRKIMAWFKIKSKNMYKIFNTALSKNQNHLYVKIHGKSMIEFFFVYIWAILTDTILIFVMHFGTWFELLVLLHPRFILF